MAWEPVGANHQAVEVHRADGSVHTVVALLESRTAPGSHDVRLVFGDPQVLLPGDTLVVNMDTAVTTDG
jgi:hypothetical protein